MANDHSSGEPVRYDIIQAVGAWVGVLTKSEPFLKLKSNPKAKKSFTITRLPKSGGKVGQRQTRRRKSQLRSITHYLGVKKKLFKKPKRMGCTRTLALMAHSNMTWRASRKLRLYPTGSKLPKEDDVRARQNNLLESAHVVTKMVIIKEPSNAPNSVIGFLAKKAPVTHIDHIREDLLDYMERLDKSGKITNRGVIPDDEVWIKVGGDHGKGSFKVAMSVCNTANPNSSYNTICILLLEGSETKANVQRVLPLIVDQLMSLEDMTWRGKKFRLWVNGDLAFLVNIYGINGCQSRYCCVYCEESKSEFSITKDGRVPVENRSLERMKEDVRKFCKAGGRKESSKDLSHSVIHPPIFPVPIDHVCIPSLHIWTGIFKKIYTMMLRELHKLDQKIFLALARSWAEDGDGKQEEFLKWVETEQRRVAKCMQEKSELEEVVEDLEKVGGGREAVRVKAKLQTEIKKLEKQLQHEELKYGCGHLVSSMDDVLKKHKVKLAAYQGGHFIGNHVDKLCKEEPINDITGHAYNTITSGALDNILDDVPISINQTLEREANDLQEHFSILLMMFAKVRKLVGHSNPIKEEEHSDIEIAITEFFQYFRAYFPQESVTLKMHILERHIMEQIQRTGCGLGLLSEHGLESLHQYWANLLHSYLHMKSQPLRMYRFCMRRHLTGVMPEVTSKMKLPTPRVVSQNER
ncbi:uncharacterized protein [Amphiura filiformis]|uniref:uncharacterized protein n=1 Tax=Amphiura filiformis TaxID=82378 RepID=UPI003B222988